MVERVYSLTQTLNMEIQGEERVKKNARWAFEPALRGGFNYTLLELRPGHCAIQRQWQVHFQFSLSVCENRYK